MLTFCHSFKNFCLCFNLIRIFCRNWNYSAGELTHLNDFLLSVTIDRCSHKCLAAEIHETMVVVYLCVHFMHFLFHLIVSSRFRFQWAVNVML